MFMGNKIKCSFKVFLFLYLHWINKLVFLIDLVCHIVNTWYFIDYGGEIIMNRNQIEIKIVGQHEITHNEYNCIHLVKLEQWCIFNKIGTTETTEKLISNIIFIFQRKMINILCIHFDYEKYYSNNGSYMEWISDEYTIYTLVMKMSIKDVT